MDAMGKRDKRLNKEKMKHGKNMEESDETTNSASRYRFRDF